MFSETGFLPLLKGESTKNPQTDFMSYVMSEPHNVQICIVILGETVCCVMFRVQFHSRVLNTLPYQVLGVNSRDACCLEALLHEHTKMTDSLWDLALRILLSVSETS